MFLGCCLFDFYPYELWLSEIPVRGCYQSWPSIILHNVRYNWHIFHKTRSHYSGMTYFVTFCSEMQEVFFFMTNFVSIKAQNRWEKKFVVMIIVSFRLRKGNGISCQSIKTCFVLIMTTYHWNIAYILCQVIL